MIVDQPLFQKQLRFFKINSPKKHQDSKKIFNKSLQFIERDQRNLHQIIRSVLKDYQYYSGYKKEQMNLSEGERVLKMNGIKVIKENNTYFIEKYITREESVLKSKMMPIGQQKPDRVKVRYCRSQTLTDPRYFLTMLGYSTKEVILELLQKEYYQYMQLECYKCPAYGIEVVIYQKWGQNHYMLIESVDNFEGMNPVSGVLIDKLREMVAEENYNQIDPYTLRPKGLKHGVMPQF